MLAHYYNRALQNGQDVAVTFKNGDLPPGAGIFDLEVGKMDQLCQFPWLTDTSIDCSPGGNWAYASVCGYKSAERLIHNLVDRVSKNGQLLLNVGPRADGTIPDDAKRILRKMGEWLRINGEAIYGTRPWYVSGEGPKAGAVDMTQGGHFNETGEPRLCAHDIRYTTQENAIYAISLGVPGDTMFLNSFKLRVHESEIEEITMLGREGALQWRMDLRNGLVIQTPGLKPSEYANTLKIKMKPGL
jgi:alpha-L-fucosidase